VPQFVSFWATVQNSSSGVTHGYRGMCLHDVAPEVVNVVPIRRRRQRTVADALADMAWTNDITDCAGSGTIH
jgi:hypothetical protein